MGDIYQIAEWTPDVDVHGNVGFREIKFDFPGQRLPGHEHNYPHATLVFSGEIRLEVIEENGTAYALTKRRGDKFTVPAKALHSMVALVPGTVCYCIFGVRDAEAGEIAEHVREAHLRDRSWHERKT